MSYRVYDYEELLGVEVSLADAVTLAEATLKVQPDPDGQGYTYTIREESGKLVALVTSRRITGTFTQQLWGGRKGNDAVYVGEESFDATDHVLLMPYEELIAVQDNRDSSDNVGTAHIAWDGPFEVTVVDSVCEYFGVERVQDITPEMLSFARERAQPQSSEVHELELRVKVKVRVNPGASLDEFIREVACSVDHGTAGVTVMSAEVFRAPQVGGAL